MSMIFEDDISDEELDKRRVKRLILNFNIENTLTLSKNSNFTIEEHVNFLSS